MRRLAHAVAVSPGFSAALKDYMGMPETGFDKPFFLGHGLLDTSVPYATTLAYFGALTSNGQPVTFRSYISDHSGTMQPSLADSVPFVRALFAK